MSNKPKQDHSFMTQLATFIVDKRNLFFLLIVVSLIFSAFSRNWVEVENDLTTFLPDDAETKLALDVMENQFTTYGTAEVMVANISYDEAEKLNDTLSEIKGVQSVAFDRTTDHYNHASALYTVTFDYDENNDECLTALDEAKAALKDYDLFVSTELGNTLQETIDAEVSVIMVYVAIIVVVVLLLTSQTYGEVPVLLLTFVTAMVLNQGTNFLLGKISFVSNSVTSILQLALSLDYAVILCNHFKEQHETLPIREAAIMALARSIPEISASSLTTVGGLAAMLFMQFKVGPDMLILVIQGSIWINFSVPYFTGTGLFFMSYLVVSSIQMGANIDYAIVIATRYQELKDKMDHKQAIIETLNFAFPTVLTSGTILTVAGTLIGQMTSEAAIVGIGQSLGRGTIISMFLVLFVLPQILLMGGDLADKTTFAVPKVLKKKETSGRVLIDGIVSGEINGTVHGVMRAAVDGDVRLKVLSGSVADEYSENAAESEEADKNE